MTHYVYGDRIAQGATLGVGCCAVIFDETRTRVLLTKRRDNGRWTLPGGMMEAGERVTEACLRETLEETGITAEVVKLIGVYSSPDRITEFPDGNRYQFVNLAFEARLVSGSLRDSDETMEADFFDRETMASMDVLDPIRDWMDDLWDDSATTHIH